MEWPLGFEQHFPTKWEIFSYNDVMLQQDFSYTGIGYVVGAKPNEDQLKHINDMIKTALYTLPCGGASMLKPLPLGGEFNLTEFQRDQVFQLDLNPMVSRNGYWAIYGNAIRGLPFSIPEAITIRAIVAKMRELKFEDLTHMITGNDLSPGHAQSKYNAIYEHSMNAFYQFLYDLQRYRVIESGPMEKVCAVKYDYQACCFELTVRFPYSRHKPIHTVSISHQAMSSCFTELLGK